jgi:hypothetical protein
MKEEYAHKTTVGTLFGKSERMTPSLPKWGLGSSSRLLKFQSSISGSKHLALMCSLYHWKAIEV